MLDFKEDSIDGENAVWITTMLTIITKSMLTFTSKVWWCIIWEQLRPVTYNNTLSPSLASLVSCLLIGYPVYTYRITATNMIDRVLNKRVLLTFP